MKKRRSVINDKLKAECLKRSSKGLCNMECEIEAIAGFCKDVWRRVKK